MSNKNKKTKKKKENIPYCVCPLTGDIDFLDEQINKQDNALFAQALANCRIKDPIYFCRISRPVSINKLINKIFDSNENGRYNKEKAYAICPSLKCSKEEFKKYLNMTSIEKFQLDFGNENKTFYIFAKYY